MRFLAPGPAEAPDSSLTHMFEILRRAEGHPSSGFDLREGRLDLVALEAAVERARRADRPLVMAGTSFAFVHFLDDPQAGGEGRWQLPAGSRVMETGGFKGRSRTVPREVLRSDIAARFGIDERAVVNQYGMTELGSQFYDSTLIDPDGPRRKEGPPWTRVRFVDPESGRDVAPGEVGMIVIHDLANTGSVAAIQTADLGRAIQSDDGGRIGFDVLGREEGAEARGCSIATDVMLEASSREAGLEPDRVRLARRGSRTRTRRRGAFARRGRGTRPAALRRTCRSRRRRARRLDETRFTGDASSRLRWQKTPFTAATIAEGLDSALRAWHPADFIACAEREIGGACIDGRRALVPFEWTTVIAGGALPMPTILQAFSRSSSVPGPAPRDEEGSRHRPSSSRAPWRDATKRSQRPSSRSLFRRTTPRPSRLRWLAPCVVATGSDETLTSIADRLRPTQRFVGYGHRFSIAILGTTLDEAGMKEAASGLALDVARWDQSGCLSPVFVYLVGWERERQRRFATILDDALEDVSADLAPRRNRIGSVRLDRAGAERGPDAVGHGGGLLFEGTQHTLVLETDARPRPAPLGRFLTLEPFPVDSVDALTRGERSPSPASSRTFASRALALSAGRLQTAGGPHDGLLLPFPSSTEGAF